MLHHDVSYTLTSLSTFFFTRRSDVEAYSMVTNSLLKVFVKKINGWKRNAKWFEEAKPKVFLQNVVCKSKKENLWRKIQEVSLRKTTMTGIWLHRPYRTKWKRLKKMWEGEKLINSVDINYKKWNSVWFYLHFLNFCGSYH